jgi:hypothetical protein
MALKDPGGGSVAPSSVTTRRWPCGCDWSSRYSAAAIVAFRHPAQRDRLFGKTELEGGLREGRVGTLASRKEESVRDAAPVE